MSTETHQEKQRLSTDIISQYNRLETSISIESEINFKIQQIFSEEIDSDQRTILISQIGQMINEAEQNISEACASFNESVVGFVFGGHSVAAFYSHGGKDVYEAVRDAKKLLEDPASSTEDPLRRYTEFVNTVRIKVYLVALSVVVLDFMEEEEFFLCLFSRLRNEALSFLGLGDDMPNWIAINQVLLKIHTVVYQLRKLESGELLGNIAISKVIFYLDDIRYNIINDERCKFFKDEYLSPELLERLEPYEMHFVHLIDFIEHFSSWSSNDIPEDPDYLDPFSYNQHSFRNICKKLLPNYDLSEVYSDGNCFYRAVIKFLMNCPEQYEERCSLLLRQLLNKVKEEGDEDSQDEIFAGFEIEGISDAITMRQPGVWADHLQVLKLSAYMCRPVWLIRYDDRNIRLEKSGTLVPGPDYQIVTMKDGRISPNEEPIVLYFIPEAHYEALKPTHLKKESVSIDETISEIQAVYRTGNPDLFIIGEKMVLILFALEEEVSRVENIFTMMGNMDEIYRSQLRTNLITAILSTRTSIRKIENLVELLRSNDFLPQLDLLDGMELYTEILKPLFEEEDNVINLNNIKLQYYDDNKSSKNFTLYGTEQAPMDTDDLTDLPDLIISDVTTDTSRVPYTLNLISDPNNILDNPSDLSTWEEILSGRSSVTLKNGRPNSISLTNLIYAYNQSSPTHLTLESCEFNEDCCQVLCGIESMKQLNITSSEFPRDVGVEFITMCNPNIQIS